jgi:hypothetical protein
MAGLGREGTAGQYWTNNVKKKNFNKYTFASRSQKIKHLKYIKLFIMKINYYFITSLSSCFPVKKHQKQKNHAHSP